MVFIIGLFCLSRVDFRIFFGFVNYWDAGKTNTVREFASLEKLKKTLDCRFRLEKSEIMEDSNNFDMSICSVLSSFSYVL